jgi:carbonic anhydrase
MRPFRSASAVCTLLAFCAGGHGAPAAGERTPPPATTVARAADVTEPADAPAVPLDPLERLRQRLAERLGAAKAGPGANPYDLQVPTRAPAAAGGARARSAAGSATGARKGLEAHAAWSYEGSAGPPAWGALRPEFSLCAKGQRQSPIDIQGGLPVDLEPVRFDYRASRFAVVDNGHTVQVNLAPGNAIEVGGRRFELQQFHFHRPAEERIDGRAFEMSLHLVHKDEQGRLAVVALLFDRGPPQPVVQQVWNHLPLEKHQETAPRVALDLEALLPADRRYYTYMGSLTTPPCSEVVQWVVMRHPVTLAPEQIDLFSRIYPMNARPLQAASGRRILQSD